MRAVLRAKLLLVVGAACLFAAVIYASGIGAKNSCKDFNHNQINTDVSRGTVASKSEIPVPKPSEWVDYGPVLEAGPEGSWDFQWGGVTPASILKKDGTYYFYYVGSDGYRSHDGEGDRHRAIGVATSHDGIRFSKYSGNPIMTHSPFNGEEEGANSAGVTVSVNGAFVMYYGAATGTKDQISADARVAVSENGLQFKDVTRVLDHRSPLGYRFLRRFVQPSGLHGHGDEIFPVAAFQYNGTWYVYYVPNGGTAPRTLGLAWGPRFDKLPCSTRALDGSPSKPVGAWGNVIWLSPHKIALFIQRLRWPDTFVEVRTGAPQTPHRLSQPVERYDIPNLKRGIVFLDQDRRTWFMYYTDFDRFWDVKLAPAGAPDTTPPTTPANLAMGAVSHDRAELFWKAANDPDTGVVIYNVYRDGVPVGSTKELRFTDTGLSELTRYVYRIAAVNFHGVEGPAAETVITTTPDITGPAVISVASSMNPTRVAVAFSEPVDSTSARRTTNYAIDNGVAIKDASLSADGRTIFLATSAHSENVTYTLRVNRISDRAAVPNPIPSAVEALYRYTPVAGLLGHWDLSQTTGTVAVDFSGQGHHGRIYGGTRAIGEALRFDGRTGYVWVDKYPALKNVTDKSFTFAAWVAPEDTPSGANGYGILLRAGAHPASFFGLSYVAGRQFQAQLMTTSTHSPTIITSGQVQPGALCHVVMVADDATRQLHLYVNGKPVSASPTTYTGTLADLNENTGKDYTAGEYYIGSTKPDRGAGSFFARHFKGRIEEASVYSRALGPGEVERLFNSGKQHKPAWHALTQ